MLYVFQAELIVGDQSGVIHIWDLKTDHNEQLIPEPEVSINSVHIDPDASYMAAVNSSVSTQTVWKWLILWNVKLCYAIKRVSFDVYVFLNREIVTCGILPEASEMK